MPIMPIGLSIDPVRPSRRSGGIAAQRDGLEGIESKRQAFGYSSTRTTHSEADLIFEADAERLGYRNRPRGIARYYRDHGMLPPRYIAEQIPRFELTNVDLSQFAARSDEGSNPRS
jgi:hypothetical protein